MTLPPEIQQIKFSDNPGNKLMAKSQKLRESSISRYSESVKFKSQKPI